MICITINQESRRFALVDMLNSAKQCDLLEIRMDRFGIAPEIGELLYHKPAPVIMSCRRPEDGGAWDGTEAERLALLRQCLANKADYLEIELDVADKIDPAPPTKRLITYTVKKEDKAADILKRYEEAQSKKPDVIKLATAATTPEEAWPLVQILAKPAVPTVVQGMGKAGIMLTVLAKKIGAPWTYAALEKGMEAYPGQPSVRELHEIYQLPDIDKHTHLVGVTGFGEREYQTVAALNAAFAHLDLSVRCLPMAVGNARLFQKIVENVKLATVVVETAQQEHLLELVNKKHRSVEIANAVDTIRRNDNEWQGYYTRGQAEIISLSQLLEKKGAGLEWLKGRKVLFMGLSPVGRVLAAEFRGKEGEITVSNADKNKSEEMASELEAKVVPIESVPKAGFEILVSCEKLPEKVEQILYSAMKPGQVIMDLSAEWKRTPLLKSAVKAKCLIVDPSEVFLNQIALQTKLITGKQVETNFFVKAITG